MSYIALYHNTGQTSISTLPPLIHSIKLLVLAQGIEPDHNHKLKQLFNLRHCCELLYQFNPKSKSKNNPGKGMASIKPVSLSTLSRPFVCVDRHSLRLGGFFGVILGMDGTNRWVNRVRFL